MELLYHCNTSVSLNTVSFNHSIYPFNLFAAEYTAKWHLFSFSQLPLLAPGARVVSAANCYRNLP